MTLSEADIIMATLKGAAIEFESRDDIRSNLVLLVETGIVEIKSITTLSNRMVRANFGLKIPSKVRFECDDISYRSLGSVFSEVFNERSSILHELRVSYNDRIK